jgi:type II secretory pathway pseudopilin PulG
MRRGICSLRNDDGQGLIELVVALTILAIGIGALLTVLTSSALSLQRSDQKGTALTLAESQLELYRNVAYSDIRLADAGWSSAPLTTGSDPYFTANGSDPTIPSGAKSGEVTDTPAGPDINACATPAPAECAPVRTVTGPDHRLYRIDTYVTPETPKDAGGTTVGTPLRRVTVVVRNAQIATLPILARNTSTFSPVNAAAFGGKSVPSLNMSVPKAWVTGVSGTTIPALSITALFSNALDLQSGQTPGTINFFVRASPTPPATGCGGTGWTPVGTATVASGSATYQTNSAATVAAGNTYWWYATFTGDPSNEARTSRCSPAMPSTVVQSSIWTPSISITAPTSATTGVQVSASSFSATLTNASPGASGGIHIKYVAAGSGPSPCPAGTQLGTTMTATSNGTYSQATGFTAPAAGTYWWWVTYDGDTNNQSVSSVCGSGMPSTVVSSGPTLVSLQMKDVNGNGKVDQVVATFDKTLGSCASPCTSGWTLSNVPSAGSLSSASVSGSTATLTLSEGSGAASTAVGLFTLQLDTSSGIVDSGGRHGSFSATAPSDGAAPVITNIQSFQSDGITAGNGKMEASDQLVLTFSEPVTGFPTSPTVTETRPNSGNATLAVPGLTAAADTGSSGYLATKSTAASYGSTAAMSGGNSIATITLGASKSGSGTPSASSGVLTFAPASSTVKDAAGNTLTATYATLSSFKLF